MSNDRDWQLGQHDVLFDPLALDAQRWLGRVLIVLLPVPAPAMWADYGREAFGAMLVVIAPIMLLISALLVVAMPSVRARSIQSASSASVRSLPRSTRDVRPRQSTFAER